jgi:excisionase family DNA binding protein
MSPAKEQWLSLSEASALLGVHPNTLRRWSDAGQVPCFRTPGGHRRFKVHELRAWMGDRETTVVTSQAEAVVQNVVGFTRYEMAERRVSGEPWYTAFAQEDERQQMRETGRRLFALAIQYMARTSNHKPVLQEGRRIGQFYGQQCARHVMSLVDTMHGFFFFRESLLRAMRPGLATGGQYDAEDARMHRQLRLFLDEVMYACLASYESYGLGLLQQGSGV